MSLSLAFRNAQGKEFAHASAMENGLVACARRTKDSREAIAQFRAAAPMPRDAQILIDKTVIEVGPERLNLVADLLAANLTYDLPNWLAVPSMYYEKIGKAGHAQRTMIPEARGERQKQDREGVFLPIPCTWDDFSFNSRELLAAERAGAPLDTSGIAMATENVNVAIEDQAFNGLGFSVNGMDAPGVFNFPNPNTFAYAGGEAWDVVGHTGEEILADVQGGIDVLDADGFYGPYTLYVPRTYWAKLSQDYKAASDKTILSRLNELGNLTVKPAYQLPANRTLLIQMTRNVVDVVVGQQPTPISWTPDPGFTHYHMILACLVVRWKSNILGATGFAIGNLT